MNKMGMSPTHSEASEWGAFQRKVDVLYRHNFREFKGVIYGEEVEPNPPVKDGVQNFQRILGKKLAQAWDMADDFVGEAPVGTPQGILGSEEQFLEWQGGENFTDLDLLFEKQKVDRFSKLILSLRGGNFGQIFERSPGRARVDVTPPHKNGRKSHSRYVCEKSDELSLRGTNPAVCGVVFVVSDFWCLVATSNRSQNSTIPPISW
jgi:hypothetical protein